MIYNKSTNKPLIHSVKWCDSFSSKFLGAMFKKEIEQGYIFRLNKPSKYSAGIHMFFVFTPLVVLWLNEEKIVVDKVLALPWRAYQPETKAKWVIELPPELDNEVMVGDYLEF